MIRFLLIFGLTILLGFTAHSQVLYGSQIDYKQLDTFKYEVRLIVYADCRDSSFSLDSNNQFYVHPNNRSSKRSLSPTLVSVQSNTPFHDTVSVCSYSTSLFRILQYTYLDTVDFNTTFSSLKNDSLILFEFYTKKMKIGDNISMGGAYRQSTNFAELYLQYNVQGGYFSTDAALQAGINHDLFLNNLVDVNNGKDSVIYAFYSPYITSGNVTLYGTWIYYNHPWPVYYPSSLQPPYNNPNASPPIGIYFDKNTGLIISTPVGGGGNYDYGVKATIYGTNSNEQRVVVGRMHRDVMLILRNIANNNNPMINGPYGYNVCAGSELCFNITTNDVVFTPPPPATAPPADTTILTWDSSLYKLGASFSVVNDSLRLKTGRFCWTPSQEHSSHLPYYFAVTVKDNHGVLNGQTGRVFGVRVKQAAKATVEFDSVLCGSKLIGIAREVLPDSNFSGTLSVISHILDSTGNPLVSDRLYFNSNNTFISANKRDTLIGDTIGLFILKTVVNNSPNNCPNTSYDRLRLNLTFPEGANLPSEWNICNQPSDSLKIIGNWTSIRWNTGDTLPRILADTARTYIAYATNSCGDVLRFKTTVYIEDSPQYQFTDTFRCNGDTLVLTYLDDEPYKLRWSDSLVVNPLATKDTGLFWVQVDKRCGSIVDSFEIKNNFPRAEVLMDSSVCGQIDFSFNQLNPGVNQFVWTQNAVKKYDSSLVSKQREQVNLHLANSCGTNQYYHIVAMPVKPQISINQDSILLCPNSTKTISASGNYSGNWRWNTGDTTTSLSVNKAGVYSIENKVHCGTAKDSFRVIANVKPNATILADSSVCDKIMYTANFIEGYENSVSWIQNSITLNVDTLYSTKEEFIQLKVVNDCGSKIVNSFLKPIASPVISILHGKPILCGDDSVKVRAVGNYRGTWQWNDGVTDTIRYFTKAGMYSISNTVYCGTATDSISIVSLNKPNAVLFADTFLCSGETLYLTSLDRDSLSTKKWSTGSKSDTLIVSSGGNYSLQLTNECGSSSDTINITQIQAPTVNLGGDKIADLPFSIELKADSSDTYLWSTSSTTRAIQVTDTGCYWVQVSNVCGNAADTLCIADTLSGTGWAVLHQLGIEVYPNPVSDVLTIKSAAMPIESVELVDLAGRKIEQYIVNQLNFSLQVSDIASGTYFLKLRIENQVSWSKVLIDRR